VDFYTEQDSARRKTRWLVLVFIVAVLLLIGITNVLIGVLIYFLGFTSMPSAALETVDGVYIWFTWERFLWVFLGVSSTVFLVVLFKWIQLSSGGKGVAERLGGERILPQTTDRDQRRCLNVVEEMALAAGLPVPAVYLLANERGINAFAAGVSPADAVIGVTQGSLDNFNREQLQGVMAHEFSHILNGDMRLNIRLAAMLKGITFVSDIGEVIVRGVARSRGVSRGSKGRGQSPQILLIGVALWVVGWMGGLFASFIKAAVSRQREHLADASAVQFTRNPGGVANALKVIGGHIPGTVIVEARATELSHIFFGQIGSALTSLFATHPPLPERIRRLEPDWNGEYIKRDREERYRGTEQDQLRAEREQQRRAAATATAAVLAGAVLGAEAGAAVTKAAADAEFPEIGPLPEREITEALVEQAHDPLGANALVCALLAGRSESAWEEQLPLLEQSGVRGLATTVRQLLPRVQALEVQWRLPLLELCLPALKCMSEPQYRVFKDTLLGIIRADRQIDLYEWCMYQVVRHYLDPEFLLIKPSKPRYRKPVHVRQEYRTVLSVLAWRGHAEADAREAAFARGRESVGLPNISLRPLQECGVVVFGEAVRKLADCYPLLKPRLLKGMAACARHDAELTAQEREILVAVAAVMDCPLPSAIRLQPARVE
jgi:Zn-dependent protease with chaperone function